MAGSTLRDLSQHHSSARAPDHWPLGFRHPRRHRRAAAVAPGDPRVSSDVTDTWAETRGPSLARPGARRAVPMRRQTHAQRAPLAAARGTTMFESRSRALGGECETRDISGGRGGTAQRNIAETGGAFIEYRRANTCAGRVKHHHM